MAEKDALAPPTPTISAERAAAMAAAASRMPAGTPRRLDETSATGARAAQPRSAAKGYASGRTGLPELTDTPQPEAEASPFTADLFTPRCACSLQAHVVASVCA
jgi:hypothetical protein